MADVKIPVATTIPLQPMDGEDFYAIIIKETNKRGDAYIMWLFRKGCSVAHFCMGRFVADATMTVDGIKALDIQGHFNENKEILLEEN